MPGTDNPNARLRWDGYGYSRIDSGDLGHAALRDGRWLMDNPRQRSAFTDAMARGYTVPAATVYATDRRYQRVVRVVNPIEWMAATATEPTSGTVGADLPFEFIVRRLIAARPDLEGKLGADAALIVDSEVEDEAFLTLAAAADRARARLTASSDTTGRPWLDGEPPIEDTSEQAERDRFTVELFENRQRREAAEVRDARRPESLDGYRHTNGRKDRPSRRAENRRAKRKNLKLGRQGASNG